MLSEPLSHCSSKTILCLRSNIYYSPFELSEFETLLNYFAPIVVLLSVVLLEEIDLVLLEIVLLSGDLIFELFGGRLHRL